MPQMIRDKQPIPVWQGRLDEAARQIAAWYVQLFPEAGGREQVAEIVLDLASAATRPETEVPTRTMTRDENGRMIESLTGPGILRLAFEGAGNWSEPAVAERILGITRAAVADQLHLDLILVGVGF